MPRPSLSGTGGAVEAGRAKCFQRAVRLGSWRGCRHPDAWPGPPAHGRLLRLLRIHPVGVSSSARLERQKTAATPRFPALPSRPARTGAPLGPFPLRALSVSPGFLAVAGGPLGACPSWFASVLAMSFATHSDPTVVAPADPVKNFLRCLRGEGVSRLIAWDSGEVRDCRRGRVRAGSRDVRSSHANAPDGVKKVADGPRHRHRSICTHTFPDPGSSGNREILLNSGVYVKKRERDAHARANTRMQLDPEVKSPGRCRPHRGNECDSTS